MNRKRAQSAAQEFPIAHSHESVAGAASPGYNAYVPELAAPATLSYPIWSASTSPRSC
jgi:hypothetical protein